MPKGENKNISAPVIKLMEDSMNGFGIAGDLMQLKN